MCSNLRYVYTIQHNLDITSSSKYMCINVITCSCKSLYINVINVYHCKSLYINVINVYHCTPLCTYPNRFTTKYNTMLMARRYSLEPYSCVLPLPISLAICSLLIQQKSPITILNLDTISHQWKRQTSADAWSGFWGGMPLALGALLSASL
jgi:uncharacterized membrane protein